MKYPTKYIITEAEKRYLVDNFYSKTNSQLHVEFMALRGEFIKLSSMLNICRRYGLRRGIQIRWSVEDISFLKDNFRKYGDTELALMLTERHSTFRMINGEKVFRKFVKKNVKKKRDLLGLKRTDEEVYNIRIRNAKLWPIWTAENNPWTRGSRDLFPEGHIRLWSLNGYHRKVIKVNGRFMLLAHYNWERENGPIPKNMLLSCKTTDGVNCDTANWELIDRKEAALKHTGYDVLSDQYIAAKLTYRNTDLRKQILQMPELIELKRNQIKLKRTINELT